MSSANRFTRNDVLAQVQSVYQQSANSVMRHLSAVALHFITEAQVNKASIKAVKDFMHNTLGDSITPDAVNAYVSNVADYVNKIELSLLNDIIAPASTANQAINCIMADMVERSFTVDVAIKGNDGKFTKETKAFKVTSLNMLKGYVGKTMQNWTLWNDEKHLPKVEALTDVKDVVTDEPVIDSDEQGQWIDVDGVGYEVTGLDAAQLRNIANAFLLRAVVLEQAATEPLKLAA